MEPVSDALRTRLLGIAATADELWRRSARRELPHLPGQLPRLGTPLSVEAVERFEREQGVVLPTEFAAFLTMVGNGGFGPDHGLLPLDRGDSVAVGAGMPRSGYFTEPFDTDDGRGGGAIAVGALGSGRYTALIVTGPLRGRLAAVDTDPGPAFPLWDAGFLDWYERWLAEVSAGFRMAGFAASMPGGETELAAILRRDEDTNASAAAIRMLGRMPQPSRTAVETLEWAVRHARDVATRTAAVDAIAARADDDLDPRLAALLDLPDPRVVERVLGRLADRPHISSADTVLRLCDASDPGVRGAALAALAHYGPLPEETLLAQLTDESADVRLAAVGQAARAWSDVVARAVTALVADPDARVRVHAMLVLRRRRLLTRELLEPLLADPDEFVRRRAGQVSAAL